MTFRLVEPIEATQADFVVCARVADLPPISSLPIAVQALARQSRQASTRQACPSCGAPILVSAEAPPNVTRVCTECHKSIKRVADRMFQGRTA